MQIMTKELSFSLWPDLEAVIPKSFGPVVRRRLKEGLASGEVLGLLAYADGKAVGYCSFGAALVGRPSSPGPGEGGVPGFYVKRGHAAVGRVLLSAALERISRGEGPAKGPVRLPGEEALVSTGTEAAVPRRLRLVRS